MGKEKPAEHYDSIYQDSEAYKKPAEKSHYFGIWKRILQLLPKDCIVAEFGCGTGQLADYLLRNGVNYAYGCDFAQFGILYAKQRTQRDDLFHLFNCELKNTFFYKDYDVAIMTELLEHMSLDTLAISHIPENTLVFFSVPNFDCVSHVRRFEKPSDIENRYYKYFKTLTIEPFRLTKSSQIFLCYGTKN
jgi:SAM-dependent methyltransferase